MSSRSWFWASALALALAVTSFARQPQSDPPPSPLLLVQGIRDSGMPDLALEYLQEVEAKLSPEDRVLVPLERARCLLDAAEAEPDEGTRASMTGEAKEAFNAFLVSHGKHPRASEASLALARLTSIEARAQLNRGRRMDVPAKDTPGYDEAVKQQRAEMVKARPMFLLASKQFAQAAGQLKERLKDAKLEPVTKQRLARETFDADLASALNKFYLAETFVVTGATDTLERDKYLEEARKAFATLADGPPTSRNVWAAKAWAAEILAEQGKPNEADREFAAITNSRQVEAEDGKRLVRFFQIQRKFTKDALVKPITVGKLQTSAQELRGWLARYGNPRRPTREALAARYYLALALEFQVEASAGTPPKAGTAPALSANQRKLLQESEQHYRALGQTDNDFTARADRARMGVVRKLMSEADRPPSAYPLFEDAQMAALIQIGKLQDAELARDRAMSERDDDAPFWHSAYQRAEVVRAARAAEARRHRVVAFLEHARQVATERDNAADVADNLLRLVYFYQQTGQPYQAAVLGEHFARAVKTTGGKAAAAGLFALRGYSAAAPRVPNLARSGEAAATLRAVFPLFPEIGPTLVAEQEQAIYEESRKADTARAIAFARFLDEKFPNDAATDTARHQLAVLLNQEKNPDAAFDAVIKVRPGYGALHSARQLQAFLARYLILSPESPAGAERKLAVFRRTAADLGKLVRPGGGAAADDASGYLGCRIQLAQLYLSQARVDKEAENNPDTRGYKRALEIADEVYAAVADFESLAETEKQADGTDGLTLEGFELKVQALDLRTRAIYIQARALVDEGKFADAAGVIGPVADAVAKSGVAYTARMQQWASGDGEPDDTEAQKKQRAEIARTAANIDKVRRDVVMVGFKLAAVQGKKDDAARMLNLLKTTGGGIAANQGTFELMARELAVQIPALRRAGKPNEAAALGEGLGLLLQEFDNLKELSTGTVLFLGQTFHTVGRHEESLKHLAKIKVPAPPASLKLPQGAPWWEADPLKVTDGQERRKFQDEVREYRVAQLYTARALRGVGRLDEAEKLLAEAVGDAKKRGYASGSIDFRKELAYAYEAKGAANPDPKGANTEWAKALREWNILFQIAQQRVREIKPKTELDPGTPEDEAKRTRNAFFDAFFEPQRVVVTANAQLIKDPAKLEASYARVAKSLTDLENVNKFNDPVEVETPQGKKKTTVGAELVTPEVAEKYWELVEKNPALKAAYTKAGGKFFLTRPQHGG